MAKMTAALSPQYPVFVKYPKKKPMMLTKMMKKAINSHVLRTLDDIRSYTDEIYCVGGGLLPASPGCSPERSTFGADSKSTFTGSREAVSASKYGFGSKLKAPAMMLVGKVSRALSY